MPLGNFLNRAFITSRLRSLLNNNGLVLAAALTVSLTVSFIWILPIVRAAAFTPGNLVIYRVGDGVAALGSTATAVFLDEYTTAGIFVQSIALPTTVSGANRILTASGTATSEGLLTRSVNGNYLILTGYNAALATASITTSTSATVNRVIGRVDASGSVDTTTALTDALSGGNPRSAASTNGTDLWISGTSSGGGIRYALFGATTSTALNTATVTNLRHTNIYNGQLYVSSQSGAFRLATVGTGTPTTGSQTITNLPGYTTSTTSPYGFFLADLNGGVAGDDTLYVADDNGAGGTGGIQKYSLVAGSWVANGSVASTAGLRGLTGAVSGNSVTLYVTSGGALFTLTDTAGYNATITGTLGSLATVAANRAFRGVAFAPTSAATTVSITATDASAAETAMDPGTFRITRTGATTSALNVSYAVAMGAGEATNGTDYTPMLTGTTSIGIGNSFVDITITPVDDMLAEGAETATLTLTDTADYDLGAATMATVTITDNDSMTLTLSCMPTSFAENIGANASTCTVTRNSSVAAALIVTLMSNDTSEATVPAMVTILMGSASAMFMADAVDDMIVDGTQTVMITASSAGFTSSSATLMVTDNDVAITPIHAIQGSGNVSPLSGSVVTEGIVTGVRPNGFYLQTPEAEYDGDGTTSQGIFVFGSPVSAFAVVGNRVRVAGTIAEFIPSTDACSNALLRPNCTPEISVTELTSPTVTLLTTGNALPTAIVLNSPSPGGDIAQLEPYEFMRVQINSLLVVAPTNGFVSESNATATSDGVFYGIIPIVPMIAAPLTARRLAPLFSIPDRPYREAGLESPEPVPPGSGVTIPPVPRFDGNPERFRIDSDGLGQPPIDVTSDAIVTNLRGVLDYAFRTYTLIPDGTLTPTVSGNLTALPLPAPNADQFYLGSFNLERLYDTVDGPGGDVVVTATALANRLNKASLAIRNILRAPDILGVVEVENLTTLQALATKINADAVAASQPNPLYVAFLVEGNDPGGIDVGFLIKTAIVAGTTPRVSVTEVVQEGFAATYINPTDGMPALLNDRPPLRFTGVVNHADGRAFPITVIVNHLRSLNGNNDPTVNGMSTEGGRVRAKRQAQAQFLANLVQARQVANPNERIALVGDFNAFKVNDGYANLMATIAGTPLADNQDVVPTGADLVNPDLINLVNDYPGSLSYTYVFGGNAQPLDHVLINEKLNNFFSQFYVAHLDADFPEIYRTDPNRPERISDHDAPIACFDFDALPDLSLTKTHMGSFTVGSTGQYTLTVMNKVNDPGPVGSTNGAITITDTLPANLTLASFSGTGWNCTGAGTANVSCTHPGPLAPGDSLPVLTITVNVLAGTPVGTNSITNTATVSTPTEDSTTLTDNTANDPTTVLAAPCPTITVTPMTVPAGVVGTAYPMQTFTATGGAGTYTFALTGTLPMGLTFASNQLSGTPMQSGAFNFTVIATDTTTMCTGMRAYTLTVTCPMITVMPTTLPNGIVGTPYQQTLTASGGTASYTFTTVSVLPMGLILSATGSISGTPMAAGAVSLNVLATDSKGCTGNATVSFQIVCPMITVTPTTLPNATVGTPYLMGTLSASGGTAPYTFTTASTLPMGLTLNSDGTITGTPMAATTVNINVIATDSKGCTGSAAVSFSIVCPMISVTPTTLPNATVGTAYTGTLMASGGTASYTFSTVSTLPMGLTLNSNGTITGTPMAAGSVNLNVVATDSKGCTGSAAVSFSIVCPTITVTPTTLPNATVGTAYTGTLMASGGTTSYNFTTASVLPMGLTLNSNGTITGTPMAAGSVNLNVVATDSKGCTGSAAVSFSIVCPTITVTPTTLPNATVGTAYTGTLMASGGTTSYNFTTASVLPMGLTLNSNGTITGTPMAAGSVNLNVVATDSKGCTGSAAVSFTIVCPTITVTPATLPNATVGTAYTGTLMASGGTTSYMFSTASALPMGLTLNSNGTITGTPMAAGSVSLNVTATDSKGCTGNAVVSFQIICPIITVTPTTLPNATAGASYTGTLSANGGNASYTFALASGSSLPTGLTLNSNGTITGTPTTVGSVNLNVVATDSKGCTGNAAVSFSIVCPTITVNVPTTNTGMVTAPFSQTFTQTGGVGAVTFSTASALPTGLTLSAAGVLSGTPLQVGSFSLTVKATDSNNCMGTASYTLTISKANTTTTVASSLNPSLINQSVTFTATVAPVAPATVTPTGTVQFKINGAAFGAPVVLAPAASPVSGETTAFMAMLANATATSQATTTLPLGAHAITAEYVGDAMFNGSTGSMTQNVIANPNVDPVPSDQKPGSVLFYNYYTSTVDAARQNTRINITNTHVTQSAYVHLFFVDGSNCSVADSYICLTPNQTASFLASDLDPGTTGYIVAVATDRTGCPIDFNYLIGDEYVKLGSGHQANLGAEAISAVAGGLPSCDATSSNVELRFNGSSYNALPRTLALSSFGSPADGNNTMLIVNRVGGNLATGAASIGSLFGLLYDDAEKAYSFALSGSSCQLRGSLSGTFPRTTPRIESIVGSGRSGWMRLSSSTDGAIFGATINFNGNAASNAGAFNQGRNLHKLTLTTAASYTIPVFPPTC